MRRLAIILALIAAPAVAATPSLTLTNLKGPIARICGTTPATSIAKLWEQINACPSYKAPAPTPTHTHTDPPVVGWEPSPTLAGKPPIASAFDPALGLQPTWGTGQLPNSAAPDEVGAFRMTCGAGNLAYIDPIVYPGKIGDSHLHQFYGLLNVTPNETYESARAGIRASTCGSGDTALNKSAYWLPALLDGKGNVLQPDLVNIYYKRLPRTSTRCNWNINPKGVGEECLNMPQGIMMLAGFNMLTASPSKGAEFACSTSTIKADNLEDMLAGCTGDFTLSVVMDFPACWNGFLDSPDHRAHLAYTNYDQGDGVGRCPKTHPKIIPTLHVEGRYSIKATDDRSLLRLASDIFPGLKRGKSLHGDALIAWDPTAHKAFHDNCIDKLLNCSGGDLGNGKQLKGASQPSYGWTNPVRLVPIPSGGM